MHPVGAGCSLTYGRAQHSLLRTAARGRSAWKGLEKFMQRNPLLVKAVPTAWGYAFGECLTQQLGPLWPAPEWPTKHNLEAHDFRKTAWMAGVGACLGTPVSLALYAWMGPASGMVVAAGQFTFEQIVGCVLWQAAYMVINDNYRTTFVAFVESQQQQRAQERPAAMAAAC